MVRADRSTRSDDWRLWAREAVGQRVAAGLQARAVWVSDGAGHRVGGTSLDTALQVGSRRRAGFQRRQRFERSFWDGVRTHPTERLRFMTLPFPGGTRQDLRYALRMLVEVIRREVGPFEYKAVYEVGAKTGVGHLHVVFFGPFIRQAWLSARWDALTGFPVVDVRDATGQLVRYMAKTLVGYLQKSDEGGGYCMQSRGWAVIPIPDLRERVLTELGRAKVHVG